MGAPGCSPIGCSCSRPTSTSWSRVLRDPPFSRLDLVSCRNLMIYLNREAQERVLGVFHFALRTDGHLLPGSSDSADHSRLFAPLDARQRIFSRWTPS